MNRIDAVIMYIACVVIGCLFCLNLYIAGTDRWFKPKGIYPALDKSIYLQVVYREAIPLVPKMDSHSDLWIEIKDRNDNVLLQVSKNNTQDIYVSAALFKLLISNSNSLPSVPDKKI